MTKKYEFQVNILGSNNGIEVKEYHQGEIIEKQDLSEELFNAWLEREIIKDLDKKADKNVDKKNDDVNNSEDKKEENTEGTTKTGEADVNKENADVDKENLEDIPVPDDAEEITKEDAQKLLIEEVKKVLEENPINTEKLKEYGIQLGIKNMAQTVNPDTIIKKVKDHLAKIAE